MYRFSYNEANLSEGKALHMLLNDVIQGNIKEAERKCCRYDGLLNLSRNVEDDVRQFKNMTPFQYALWARDWDMVMMMGKYMNRDDAIQQLEQLESRAEEDHGSFFSFESLINILQDYQDFTGDLNDHIRFWSTKISPVQMMLPKHVVRELARDDYKDYKAGFLVMQNGFLKEQPWGYMAGYFGEPYDYKLAVSPSEDVQHTILILTALSDDLERRYSEFRELLLSGSAFSPAV